MQVDIHSENNCINQNLSELIFSSLSTENRTTKSNSTISCSSCNICKNCMVFESAFYLYSNYVKGELDWNSCNTMYLAECSKCEHQYIGSTLNFKQQVMIYRSGIKTNKSCCETARQFNNMLSSYWSQFPFTSSAHSQVQIRVSFL